MPQPVCPPPAPAPRRSYPYQLVAGDPLPCRLRPSDVASDTYYASGVLWGKTSGRSYAFRTIFAKNEEILEPAGRRQPGVAVPDGR